MCDFGEIDTRIESVLFVLADVIGDEYVVMRPPVSYNGDVMWQLRFT